MLLTSAFVAAQDQPPPAREREAHRSQQPRAERRPRAERPRIAPEKRRQTDRRPEGPRPDARPEPHQPPPPPAAQEPLLPQVHVVALERASAHEAAKVVDQVFVHTHVQVAVDERTNSVILSGSSGEALEHAIALLGQLDQPRKTPVAPSDAVQSVVLKAAEARDVAGYLHEIAPFTRGVPPVRFVADPGARTVWIAGVPELVDKFVQLAHEMDATTADVQGAVAEQTPELHFHKLRYADAGQVSGTINQVLKTMSLPVKVVPDTASNVLIAFAGGREHELITQMISELDVQGARPAQHGERKQAAETPPAEGQ